MPSTKPRGSTGTSDTGHSCSDYRTREVGHGPETFGHGRHSLSQDFPQLRTFLGRNVSPLGEKRSGTHLETNRPSERSSRPSWGALTDWGLRVLLRMPEISLESHKLSTKRVSGKS